MKDTGSIGAYAEKGSLSKRDLTGISCKKIPGGTDNDPYEHEDHKVLVVILPYQQGKNPHQDEKDDCFETQFCFFHFQLHSISL